MNKQNKTKYIVVCGGVISGIGKGVIASSTGLLMKSFGLTVTMVKIDPYVNVDSGLIAPQEHGECYTCTDGFETDLDIGNYERFVDIELTGLSQITTGKIYRDVIEKERRGDYLGKTVQVVPHITNYIQEWIEKVGQTPMDGATPDICIVELGGTVGDIESAPFIEALRQFQFRVGQENFALIMVSLIPEVGNSKEQKTKPTQACTRDLMGLGLRPDVIACRSERTLEDSVREKISMFCHVNSNQVIGVQDCESVWHVPHLLKRQGLIQVLQSKLNMNLDFDKLNTGFYQQWTNFTNRYDRLHNKVTIVLVGKYTALQDCYLSVMKSLQHASLACNRKLDLQWIEASDLEEQRKSVDPLKYHHAWKLLCSAEGIIVPGGFGERGTEGKITACKYARENNVPFLGICLGLQLAVIEYARNVCGIQDAYSEEFPPLKADGTPSKIDPKDRNLAVVFMPEVSKDKMGGTMRLGSRPTHFLPYPGTKDEMSVVQKLYGKEPIIHERHRHRYEVNPLMVDELERRGMYFVGKDDTNKRMEILELGSTLRAEVVDPSKLDEFAHPKHPYFVAVQFHPEYKSRPLRPSPPFMGLILAASKQLGGYIASLEASDYKRDGLTPDMVKDVIGKY